MDWDIVSFERVGPLAFGMTREQVAELIGPPERVRDTAGRPTEFRALDLPVVHYDERGVKEIETYYDVESLRLGDLRLFGEDGAAVMRELERRNGGALIDVGIVLFDRLGLTCGRLDEAARGDHSVTAFRKGQWDGQLGDFEPISFLDRG